SLQWCADIVNVYLLPLIRPGNARAHWKHFGVGEPFAGLLYSAKYFNDLGLVWVQDVPPAAHAAVSADPDVIALPDDLDSKLGDDIQALAARLEAVGVPADDVSSAGTYREAIRILVARMLVSLAVREQGVQAVDGARTLDSAAIDSTTVDEQMAINEAA